MSTNFKISEANEGVDDSQSPSLDESRSEDEINPLKRKTSPVDFSYELKSFKMYPLTDQNPEGIKYTIQLRED